MRHILEIHIAIRPTTKLDRPVRQSPFATPDAEEKCPHHIRTIQQRTARPELPVIGPALGHPVYIRSRLLQAFDHDTRTRGSLAIEETRLQSRDTSTADEEAALALLVALLDEGNLARSHGVAPKVCAHEEDIEGRAGLEGVLCSVSRARRRLAN